MIKVLHVIDHLGLGGGQRSVKNIVENMHGDKFQNIVCSLRPVNKPIDIKSEVITLNYGKWNPLSFFAFIRLCKNRKVDIIHSHTRKATIFSLLANYLYPSKIVLHERGAVFQKGFINCLYRFFLRILHSKASIIIANSQTTGDKLSNLLSKTKLTVIRNAVDFSEFDNCNLSCVQARNNIELAPDDIVLGYSGRLSHIKGTDILIKTLEILLAESPNYRLILIGDGPQKQKLEKAASISKINDSIIFLGMCDNVPEILAACDFGLVPSRWEAFGRSAVEFMRMKVPVICSGKDGLAELVENEVTGLVTSPNTPEKIAQAVERLRNDEKLRQKIIENAYAFSSRFDIKEHVAEIASVYEQVFQDT